MEPIWNPIKYPSILLAFIALLPQEGDILMRIVLILRHPLDFTTIYYTFAKGPMLRIHWSRNLTVQAEFVREINARWGQVGYNPRKKYLMKDSFRQTQKGIGPNA